MYLLLIIGVILAIVFEVMYVIGVERGDSPNGTLYYSPKEKRGMYLFSLGVSLFLVFFWWVLALICVGFCLFPFPPVQKES